MAEPTIQLGGGNWAGKSGQLTWILPSRIKRFYAEDFTFSRSTTGTYTDSDGYIQEMPYNLLHIFRSIILIMRLGQKDKLTAIIGNSIQLHLSGTKNADKI